MEKINFSNGEKISAAKVTIDNVDYEVTPAEYDGATPLNATVFNNMQENIENAINTKADADDVYEKTETYTKTETDALIPTKAHQVNVSTEVDNTYRVNLLKTKNLCDEVTYNLALVYTNNTVISDSDSKTVYAKVPKNTDITISKTNVTNRFRVVLLNEIPKAGLTFNANQIVFRADDSTTLTATINSGNYQYVAIQFTNSNQSTNIQVEEGSTATEYTPFINNQINVDNEKYSDTINVGAVEDSRSRVNILFSKELYNSATITNDIGINDANGNTYADSNLFSTDYIDINGASDICWYGSANATGVGIWGAFYNSSKQFVSGITTTNTTIAVPNNAKYVRLSMRKIYTNSASIQKGTSIITPSIKVDNEEIYSNMFFRKVYYTTLTDNSYVSPYGSYGSIDIPKSETDLYGEVISVSASNDATAPMPISFSKISNGDTRIFCVSNATNKNITLRVYFCRFKVNYLN